MENLPVERVDNLIGTTSLPQLIDIIGNAELVVGNDTSAIHIAVAAKRKSVCILGGGHFERFVPYPQHFESAPVCCYYKMECYNCNWHCIFTSASNEPFPCISNVNVPDVWKAVLPLLQQYIN
jgi:ADP-heptose:LPS heptosyltransferase